MNNHFAYPLTEFYSHAKLPLPRMEPIPGDAVPEPYRSLLVHNNDMTPTLESFHNARIYLEILSREQRGDFYYREVILRSKSDETPFEFGANKVYLGRYPEEARDLILAEEVPLGRILKDCGVKHHTEAKAFFRIESDELINRAFDLPQPVTLFGRKALICDEQSRPLSEIVEILPPGKPA